jgi:hypothetical protein
MGGITMTGTAKADTARQRRAVFAVDEDAALAALEEAWADGGYHGFSADGGTWSAVSSAGGRAHRLDCGRAGCQDPGALAGQAVRRVGR